MFRSKTPQSYCSKNFTSSSESSTHEKSWAIEIGLQVYTREAAQQQAPRKIAVIVYPLVAVYYHGVARSVRDVLQANGFVELEGAGVVRRKVLSGASALARHCAKWFRVWLRLKQVRVVLGET